MDSNGRNQLQIDLTGAVVRPPTLVIGRSFKGSPSLTPTSSPSFRRVSPTVRTPNRDNCSPPKRGDSNSKLSESQIRGFVSGLFSGRRLFPWIVFIILWTLVGLHVQFKWFYMVDLTPSNEEISAHIPRERRSLEDAFDDNAGEEQFLATYPLHREFGTRPAWNIEWVWKVFKGWGWSFRESVEGRETGKGDESLEYRKHAEKPVEFENSTSIQPGNVAEGGSRKRLEGWGHEKMSSQEADDLNRGLDIADDLPGSSSEVSHGNAWSTPGTSNITIGKLVGPFDQLEGSILGLNKSEKQQGSGCNADSMFAKVVSGKSLVIVFHELSMTGAPLSMLELGTKMRNCGGRVSAVVLNKQGGLHLELVSRGIRILQDRAHHSWSAAAKADLVVVGSAVCSSWVNNYLKFNPKGGDRLVWWVMENRREYFERSKFLLGRARTLLFLSDTQAKIWKEWSVNEGLNLAADTDVISLSVNEDLASIAGVTNKSDAGMAEMRTKLRAEVRKEMGLEPNDVLIASLSSINPGKGQLLFLQAALMVVDHVENEGLPGLAHVETNSALEWRSRRTFLTGRQIFSLPESLNLFSFFSSRGRKLPAGKDKHSSPGKEKKSKFSRLLPGQGRGRKSRLPLAKGKKSSLKQRGQNFVRNTFFRLRPKSLDSHGVDGSPRLRILIGSVGSKSNKPLYLEKIQRLLDRNERLAKLTLSTASTTHVAPLYAAADAYVMNAQGIGETFGRVTVEAMAFGLPVLATNAGGSKEIISNNVTGLLHPTGRAGVPALAQHIRWLLDHSTERQQMGQMGRDLVYKLYQEDMMYEKLANKFNQVLGSARS